MKPFLHLPSSSNTDVITFRDVFNKDLLRLLVAAGVLLALSYGVGALIAANESSQRQQIGYYVWLLFSYTPVMRLIVPAGFCILAMGLKRNMQWWLCLLLSEFIFIWSPASRAILFETSGALSLIFAVLLFICGWRLWDYYELRRVYHFNTPYLTRPALGIYIVLAVLSVIMILPYKWIPWF